MFDALSVDYKIDFDDAKQTIIGFEVYLDEKDDEIIGALTDISKTMSDWIRDVEPFVTAIMLLPRMSWIIYKQMQVLHDNGLMDYMS